MRLRAALATAVAALALAAPAQADDNSLFAAYTGHEPERQAAAEAYWDAYDDLKRGGATDKELEAIIAVNEQINATSTVVRNEIAAQEPSSEEGVKVKKLSLKEFDLAILMNVHEINRDKARIAGSTKKMKRWDRRFKETRKKYRRAVRRTHTQWLDMGFKPIDAKVVR